ncbi:MAG: sulfatase [Bacteroidota bacterium]
MRIFSALPSPILCLVLTFVLGLSGCSSQDQPPASPPNIIMFLVDDMGWQDSSVPFWTQETDLNRIYHTPAMERLAKDGMKFTQAYATSVCSPTRISLMTGMNAVRHRVTNWTLNKNVQTDREDDIIQPPAWAVNGLSPEAGLAHSVHATPLPAVLQEHGYFTIHVGKAHFAARETSCENPLNCGFDINIAGHAAGGLGSYYGRKNFGNHEDGSHKLPWGVPGLEAYHGQDIYLTEALTREAKKSLDQARRSKQPFYLYMSHYAIHAPIQEDPRFFQKYIDAGLDTIEARYASMIEAMDKSLGDLMDYLDEHQLTENTIILFMSDNGGLSAIARAGEAHTHNRPLSSGKGSAHEGGIREPMLVKWPGVVQPGSRCDDYLIIEDFFPSMLEMAGIRQPSLVQTVDGKSFVPMLKQIGTTATGRNLFWHMPNNWGPTGPGIGSTSTVRSEDWKLIYYHRDRSFELFNIAQDIGEQNNLADQEPVKLQALAHTLTDYLKTVDAQMPTDKHTGQLVEYPDEVLL